MVLKASAATRQIQIKGPSTHLVVNSTATGRCATNRERSLARFNPAQNRSTVVSVEPSLQKETADKQESCTTDSLRFTCPIPENQYQTTVGGATCRRWTGSGNERVKQTALLIPSDALYAGRFGAWIMMLSTIPFAVVQIPLLDGQPAQGPEASLIGAGISFVGLAAYCAYQVGIESCLAARPCSVLFQERCATRCR